MRNQFSHLCTWLSALFLGLAMRLNGRSSEEIQQAAVYVKRVLEPPIGEIEEVEP